MQIRTNSQRKLIFLCISAFLASLSIVLGKYLAINIGETIRFSFENLPILFASLYFGPVTGVCVAVVADLLGCLLVGYTINPVITLGAAMIGLTAGIIKKLFKKPLPCLLLSVSLAHLTGSVLIKTVGLYWFYKMPFWETLLLRTANYSVVIVAEFFVLYFLSKSNALTNEVQKITSKGDAK